MVVVQCELLSLSTVRILNCMSHVTMYDVLLLLYFYKFRCFFATNQSWFMFYAVRPMRRSGAVKKFFILATKRLKDGSSIFAIRLPAITDAIVLAKPPVTLWPCNVKMSAKMATSMMKAR